MSDQGVFENSDDAKKNEQRRERVSGAFGALHESIGERASQEDIERLRNIREAVISGDRSRAKAHLTAAKSESSWLYEELMKHPEICIILQDLSIMGF